MLKQKMLGHSYPERLFFVSLRDQPTYEGDGGENIKKWDIMATITLALLGN